MSTITRIEITHHQLPLDPPFPASWDPQPRTKFPATIVRVHDSDGRVGIGSGDAMYGFADYQRYYRARRDELAAWCKRLGWSYTVNHTDRPASDALVRVHLAMSEPAGFGAAP